MLLLGGSVFLNHLFGQSQSQDSPLLLKVQPVNDRLLLSWDRDASLVLTADRATLTIADGERKEDVDLDLNYFRCGKIMYLPISNDISFRLQVSNRKEGRTAVGSVRFLNFRSLSAEQDLEAYPSLELAQPTESEQLALDSTSQDASRTASSFTVEASPMDVTTGANPPSLGPATAPDRSADSGQAIAPVLSTPARETTLLKGQAANTAIFKPVALARVAGPAAPETDHQALKSAP